MHSIITVDAGLFSYDKKRLAAAIWRCTRNSIPTLRDMPDSLSQVDRSLRRAIRAARLHRSGRDGRFEFDRYEGFVRDIQGQTTYVVPAKDFRARFDRDPLLFQSALMWLDRRGCLRARRARRAAAIRPADWAERAVIWPDGRTVRSIEFFDPFQ